MGGDRLNAINILAIVLGSGGLLGFLGTVYQVKKNSHNDAAKAEVEAAAQETANWEKITARIENHLEYQDRQIKDLRAEVNELKQARQYDQEHIRILQRQIWAGIGPPPLKPGDEWPDIPPRPISN